MRPRVRISGHLRWAGGRTTVKLAHGSSLNRSVTKINIPSPHGRTMEEGVTHILTLIERRVGITVPINKKRSGKGNSETMGKAEDAPAYDDERSNLLSE